MQASLMQQVLHPIRSIYLLVVFSSLVSRFPKGVPDKALACSGTSPLRLRTAGTKRGGTPHLHTRRGQIFLLVLLYAKLASRHTTAIDIVQLSRYPVTLQMTTGAAIMIGLPCERMCLAMDATMRELTEYSAAPDTR